MSSDIGTVGVAGALPQLAELAWRVRENAYVLGPTRVGCAVMTDEGQVYTGANVEHRYRSHDVHAEVNAITSMVASGARRLAAIVIVAERELFTPCGACMDWIFQFGGADCTVAFQGQRDGQIAVYSSGELMPFYPR